jgi:hypothetical protein
MTIVLSVRKPPMASEDSSMTPVAQEGQGNLMGGMPLAGPHTAQQPSAPSTASAPR